MIGQSASQQQQQQKLYGGRLYEPRTFSYFCGMEFGKASKNSLNECEINRDMVCCHMYYKSLFRAVISLKLFLEELYTLDRFA